MWPRSAETCDWLQRGAIGCRGVAKERRDVRLAAEVWPMSAETCGWLQRGGAGVQRRVSGVQGRVPANVDPRAARWIR